jgi:hypothetical protein
MVWLDPLEKRGFPMFLNAYSERGHRDGLLRERQALSVPIKALYEKMIGILM